MSKKNPYGIDKDEDIISFLNIDEKKLYSGTVAAISNFGMEYEDKHLLNEHLYCVHKTLDCVRSSNSKKHGRKFSDKTVNELKDLINLIDEYNCSYIRIINP